MNNIQSVIERILSSYDGQNSMEKRLGPNWLFHMEQELIKCNPELLRQDVDQQAVSISSLIIPLYRNVINGENIKNNDTLEALYNWQPQFLVRDQLAANPDWIIQMGNIEGLPVVIRVHHRDNIHIGRYISPHTFTKRLELWKIASEKALKDSSPYCIDCILENPRSFLRIPKLERQIAQSYFYSESIPKICENCNETFIVKFLY